MVAVSRQRVERAGPWFQRHDFMVLTEGDTAEPMSVGTHDSYAVAGRLVDWDIDGRNVLEIGCNSGAMTRLQAGCPLTSTRIALRIAKL